MSNPETFTYTGSGWDGLPEDMPEWALKLIEEGTLYEVYDCGMVCMEYRTPDGKTDFLETHREYKESDFAKVENPTNN